MKLKRVPFDELKTSNRELTGPDEATTREARSIVERVRIGGEESLREIAESFGELALGQALVIGSEELEQSLSQIDDSLRDMLQRVAQRIRHFAEKQLQCFHNLETPIDGGRAGHQLIPIERVGCYVPGGRYPLVSTALMTVVTARTAGCRHVLLATPSPDPTMLAAAAVAGADGILRVGGAHAIAALAYGMHNLQPVDLVVGPGNRWVTAAKQLLAGTVGIDMLAGPTELVVVADEKGEPAKIAADLIAQAEHDIDARPMLVTTQESLIQDVETALEKQLERLPTAETARASLQANGCAVICDTLDDAIEAANQIAPEHLELMCQKPREVATRIRHAGCLFWGQHGGEVFGDYGVGPNHTLPTSGTARFTAGLNVLHFVRVRSWIEMDQLPTSALFDDVTRMAECEGLWGHAAACEIRRGASQRKA